MPLPGTVYSTHFPEHTAPRRDIEKADTDLLERSNELRRFQQLIAAAHAGQGICVLLQSEAGGGKTTLLKSIIAQAPPGTAVYAGACEALHTPRPLGPFIDMCASLPNVIVDLLCAERVDRRLFPAFLSHLQQQTPPALLVIEDLHWADGATLDLFKHLARRIANVGVVMVGTYRTEELPFNDALRTLLGDIPAGASERLRLAPLSLSAVAQLCGGNVRAAQALHTATGGNPFFVTEVLADADEDDSVPASVRDAVLARLSRLSRAAHRVCEWVSLAPSRMDLWLLQQVCADSDAIDECARHGVLSVDGDGVSFRHDLARQVVYEAVPPTARARMSHAIFTALGAQRGSSLARLVHYAHQAGLTEEIYELGPRAARVAAQAGARREAASLLALVLTTCDFIPPLQRAAMLEEYAQACALTGAMADGRSATREALQLYRTHKDTAGEGRVLVIAAFFGAGNGESVVLIGAARCLLEQLPPGRDLATAYMITAFNTLGDDPHTAHGWACKAVALAEALDDPTSLAHALDALAATEVRIGYHEASTATCERALGYALQHGADLDAASVFTTLVTGALAARDYARLIDCADRALAFLRERDMDAWIGSILTCRARGMVELGRWDDAQNDLALLAEYHRLPLKLVRGANTPPFADPRQRYGSALAAVLHMRGCQPNAQHWAQLIDGPHQVPKTLIAAYFAEACWLAGDIEQLERVVETHIAAATESDDPWMVGNLVVWLVRAGRLPPTSPLTLPDPIAKEIDGDVRGAAAAWCQLGCRYEQGLALLAGDVADIQHAVQIFTDLGAESAAVIARSQLKTMGLPVARGPYQAAHQDPLGLTARQRQVFDLLVTGLSNRDIARQLRRSIRTVDNHVTAIYRKLNLSSRRELWTRSSNTAAVNEMR